MTLPTETDHETDPEMETEPDEAGDFDKFMGGLQAYIRVMQRHRDLSDEMVIAVLHALRDDYRERTESDS